MEEDEIFKFEKVQNQIDGFYKEIGILSKKNPNDLLNKFKLKFINQILVIANSLLTGDYKPLEGFDSFDEEELPSNSDVTMILEQYLNCLERLRGDHVEYHAYEWVWLVDGEPSEYKTTQPLKYKDKK